MQLWAIGYWVFVVGLFAWTLWNIHVYRKFQRRTLEVNDRLERLHNLTSRFLAMASIRDNARAAGNEELAKRIDQKLAQVVTILLGPDGGAERASVEMSVFALEHGLDLPLSQ